MKTILFLALSAVVLIPIIYAYMALHAAVMQLPFG